jgi:hypothetical protein
MSNTPLPKRITEKQLEDWICQNPEKALWYGTSIIDRQVGLPHGILDVLAYDGHTLVIELKARKLQERDIGQVLRYTHDVLHGLQQIGRNDCPIADSAYSFLPDAECTFPSRQAAYEHLHYYHLHGYDSVQPGFYGDVPIIPVLIGTGADESLLAASRAANITVLTWHINQKTEEIETVSAWPESIPDDDCYPEWAQKLHSIFLQTYKHDASLLLKQVDTRSQRRGMR